MRNQSTILRKEINQVLKYIEPKKRTDRRMYRIIVSHRQLAWTEGDK